MWPSENRWLRIWGVQQLQSVRMSLGCVSDKYAFGVSNYYAFGVSNNNAFGVSKHETQRPTHHGLSWQQPSHHKKRTFLEKRNTTKHDETRQIHVAIWVLRF